jgi:hypothetical protein
MTSSADQGREGAGAGDPEVDAEVVGELNLPGDDADVGRGGVCAGAGRDDLQTKTL